MFLSEQMSMGGHITKKSQKLVNCMHQSHSFIDYSLLNYVAGRYFVQTSVFFAQPQLHETLTQVLSVRQDRDRNMKVHMVAQLSVLSTIVVSNN